MNRTAPPFRAAVQAFGAAGWRYLQLDEVNLAYLCDPEQRERLRQGGDDPDRLPTIYANMINTAIAGRPADMTVTMHLCSGNFRSSWIAQGGYFMEFDTERLSAQCGFAIVEVSREVWGE